MTDHDRPAPDAEHPDVTALLAADPAPPIPDDVAARLQAALREESGARATRDRTRVTPIEAARRRRRVVPALAAAAVVVGVVAVGGTALVRSGDGAGDESASSSSDAGSGADKETSEPGALAAPEEPDAADGSGGRRLADAQEAVDTDQAPAALPSRPGALTCTDDQLDVVSRLAVSYRGDLAWLVTVPADGAGGPEYVVYGCQGTDARRLAVVQPS